MEIALNKTIERHAVVRAVSDEMLAKRQVEFVISTEAPDTYGTVFKSSGWDLKRYQNNPVVFYAHKSYSDNPDLLVGTSSIRQEGSELIGVVTFEEEEINPLAEKVLRKIAAGTLRMASISAIPKKGHWGDDKLGEDRDLIYFDEQELLEWSIVPIGSNPEALKRNADNVLEYKNTIIRELAAVTPSAPENKKRTVREAQLIINQNSYKK